MSHTQLNQLLTKWQELQQQQNTEFDQIMEDDLEYRLKQLEQEEEEQYQHIEQVLELKLQEPEKNREELDEFERYCMKLIEEFDEQQPQQQQHIKLQQKEVEQPKHSHSQVARQQRTEKLQRQQRAQQMQLDQVNALLYQTERLNKHLAMRKQTKGKGTNKMNNLLKRFFGTKKNQLRK